ETISSTSVISKTGYHLVGWKDQDNNDYGTTGTVDVNPTDTTPVTLTAQWEVNTYTIKYNSNASTTPDCSSTVHPTTSEGCKMADGRIWIIGNSGNTIAWDNIFTGATNVDGHDATVNSGICPAGYSAPTIVDFDNLIIAYGGTSYYDSRGGYRESTGALYSVLGLSGYRYFWPSTENGSSNAYYLGVRSGYSSSSGIGGKDSNGGYVLCYKATSSASGSTADQTSQAYNTNVTLRANGYTLEGYDFLGWSLDPSATSASYSAGTSYAVSTLANAANVQNTNGANITLYAIWKQKRTVTITSGTGISSTTGAGTYSVGQTVNISATPSSGYNFSSWTVNSGGASLASTTSSSTSFTMPDADVTITANGAVIIIPNCSASVHPGVGVTNACKMPNDGRQWFYGNNGDHANWRADMSSMCSGGTVPTKADYETLISREGSDSQLYSLFGLSSKSEFWSSTKMDDYTMYYLYVYGSNSRADYAASPSHWYYVLCFK
ncbi:InlB B-repeat-containing protein, partial [Candidatus Saccharibacteria bacterium]|nr:InlB B-repeat-containing protein [Candidatus Saccharibacteria bacterium]